MQEEPDAAAVISAALNEKNAIGLIPHEMEAIKLLSKYCTKEAALAGDVCFDKMREKVAAAFPTIAQEPEFIHCFKFVVEPWPVRNIQPHRLSLRVSIQVR